MRISLVLILVGLLLATWWALRPSAPPRQEPTSGEREVVDYFISGLDLTTYDARGTPLRRLWAKRVDHFRGKGGTRLIEPRLLLLNEGRVLWNIHSESGTLSPDRSILHLHGAVEITRAETEALPSIHLQTRDMLVKPEEEYAETEAPVTITSQANWIKAVGMQAWLRNPGKIHFMANTRAYYVAE